MKTEWSGRLVGVQPRIRLTRSFDQRYHTYLGYLLRVSGTIGGQDGELEVAVGRKAQARFLFQVGDTVRGASEPVLDDRLEIAGLYKTARLAVLEKAPPRAEPPPWLGIPPDLDTYRSRGHRRLSARTYESKCRACIWGCRMAVEMIIDHWKPGPRRFRVETFCYGPKSCPLYRPGPTRKVPGRRGMTWEEADWVDEDATAHRSADE
jgi:hypothetical protein